MNWILVLLGVYVVLGVRPPGRMGSTYVTLLVATAAVLGWTLLRMGA
jgi:hypothetical protein